MNHLTLVLSTKNDPFLSFPPDSFISTQLMGLYMANLARLIKPQGPQFYMELDFATCVATDHVPGWESLPFMLGSGRVVRPSLVDLKALTSGQEQSPDKTKLEKVRALILVRD